MRRLISSALATGLLFAAACRRQERARVDLVEDSAPSLSSVVHVADPRASMQLVKGFHDIEQGAWRWTMGKFAVTLRPPRNAAEKGAMLQLKFALPDSVIEKVKAVTITANVNGTTIESETFSKAGDHVYSKPVAASALTGEAVPVDFTLDKFLPPGSVDQRELGIVVSTIGLEAR